MLVKYTRTNIYSIGNITLKPGMNDVSPKAVKDFTALEKKAWDSLKESGDLEELRSKAALTAKMVSQTSDMDLLKKWASDENLKKPLMDAVLKQIADIEAVVDEIADKKAKKDEVL